MHSDLRSSATKQYGHSYKVIGGYIRPFSLESQRARIWTAPSGHHRLHPTPPETQWGRPRQRHLRCTNTRPWYTNSQPCLLFIYWNHGLISCRRGRLATLIMCYNSDSAFVFLLSYLHLVVTPPLVPFWRDSRSIRVIIYAKYHEWLFNEWLRSYRGGKAAGEDTM